MHSDAIIVQLSFFIIFALFGTILSTKFKQPYVVGLLLLGSIAGPNMLGFVKDDTIIELFSQLGAILLLFTIGIEFSVSRILKAGLRATFITIFKMAILFAAGYEVALYFGLDFTAALFLGAMISITSTTLLYKITIEKGMAKNKLMPLLFSMLIVEDFIAVAALTFFSSLSFSDRLPTIEDKLISVLFSFGLLGAFYILFRKPAAQAITRLTSSFNMELMIFVSFSLCMFMALLSQSIGLSPSIGAFLAGSIISSVPHSRRIERTIRPLLLTFASLFFLSLGMQVDPLAIVSNFPLALSFFFAFLVVCFFSVLWLLFATGSSSKSSLFGASAMVVLGEFSLLIASVAPPDIRPLLLAIGSFSVIASAAVSSFLLDRQKELLEFGLSHMPLFLQRSSFSVSTYLSGLLRDFSYQGTFWKVAHICWSCIKNRVGWVAAIIVMIVAAHSSVSFLLQGFPNEASLLKASLLTIGILLLSYLAVGILRDVKPVLDLLSATIARHKKNASVESKILRDFAIIIFLVVASTLINELVISLSLPGVFLFVDELALVLAFFFFWDLLQNAILLGKQKSII
ncbi:MAG: cation:proton antiporter [Candidatus Micrarchaeota archaeon]|nr:cation:proton antiporter [Candidatus Micrarchaeota archaeon]